MNARLEALHAYPFERLARLKAGLTPPPALKHIAMCASRSRRRCANAWKRPNASGISCARPPRPCETHAHERACSPQGRDRCRVRAARGADSGQHVGTSSTTRSTSRWRCSIRGAARVAEPRDGRLGRQRVAEEGGAAVLPHPRQRADAMPATRASTTRCR